MKKIVALVSGLTLLLQTMPVDAIDTQQSKPKTFTQWCEQRNSVPAATKLTIDLLLTKAGTKNCKLADSKLNSLTQLELSEKNISDLQPLSGFTELISLNLYGNKISDIKPIGGLTNLIDLNLNNNKIINIKPLSGLSQLKTIYLQNNRISDIKPLSKLSKLDSVCLFNNKIVLTMKEEERCKL
jgi:internalin A